MFAHFARVNCDATTPIENAMNSTKTRCNGPYLHGMAILHFGSRTLEL